MGRRITGRVFTKRGKWFARFRHEGFEKNYPLNVKSEEAAENQKNRLIQKATEELHYRAATEKKQATPAPRNCPVGVPVLIKDLFNVFFNSPHRSQCGDGSIKNYKEQISVFVEYIKDQHPNLTFAHELRKGIVEQYLIHLRSRVNHSTKRTISLSTVNKHINSLHRLFDILLEQNSVDENHWPKTKRPKQNATFTKENFTIQQIRLMLDSTDGERHALVYIGHLTGMRLGDAATLRWDSIDFPDRMIAVVPRKTGSRTGKQAFIPIGDHDIDYLKELKSKSTSDYVCPELCQKYLHDRSSVSRIFSKVLKNIGIESFSSGGHLHKYGYHSFRGTVTVRLLEASLSYSQVQDIMGWSGPEMIKIYDKAPRRVAESARQKVLETQKLS